MSSTPEIGTDTGHCNKCGSDVLIETIASDGKTIDVVDGYGRLVRSDCLIEVRMTPDTKAALNYHESGRCIA